MNVKLIPILEAGGLGAASGGVCALCFLLSRPYRKALNRIAILLAQLCVGTSAVGGMLLLSKLAAIAVLHDRSSRQSAVYAYVLGLFSVLFFVLRAEIRWQLSWKPARTISEPPLAAPGAMRRLIIAFTILGSSWLFAIAFLLSPKRPSAPLLVGFASLSILAGMIFIGRVLGPPHTGQIRKVTVVSACLLICFFGQLAFKSRVNAPTQTSAWIVSVTLVCVALMSALFFLRPGNSSANLD